MIGARSIRCAKFFHAFERWNDGGQARINLLRGGQEGRASCSLTGE
jgi:hypothetical protein